ncbi:MAG TPA: hypothetical protein VIU02_09845, partial [Burkholderiales bacterium]
MSGQWRRDPAVFGIRFCARISSFFNDMRRYFSLLSRSLAEWSAGRNQVSATNIPAFGNGTHCSGWQDPTLPQMEIKEQLEI